MSKKRTPHADRKPLRPFAPKVAAERAKYLSDRQKRVLAFVKRREQATIKEIAESVFARERPAAKRHSWARNQLRRLRQCRLVKKVDEGTYVAA